jgi:intracellular septation protein A
MKANPVVIFGREQAVYLALIAGVFQVVSAYGFDADGHFQGVVTAVLVFMFGVYTAITHGDGIIAMASGVVVAAGSLFAAFGLDWAAQAQSNVLALITVFGSFWLRSAITSPIPASVSPPGKLVANTEAV